jgi:pimeloyl-ACP methyl ester carboxylesterase
MKIPGVVLGSIDAPHVTLIHGLGASHHSWDRVVPQIANESRIFAPDLATAGRIEHEADGVADRLTAPTIVVGHSRGALVATALAERHPHRAQRLILICPPWSTTSRLSTGSPTERALATPVIGHILWALAIPTRQHAALRTAFGPVGHRSRRRSTTDSGRRARLLSAIFGEPGRGA